MVTGIRDNLTDAADNLSRLADELRHGEHEPEHIEALTGAVELLSQSIDDLASAVRYATNNLLDEQYHPEMAAALRAVSSAEPKGSFEADTSKEERAEGLAVSTGPEQQAETIPDQVVSRITGIVEALQMEAKQHQAAADYGSVTEMQWWELQGNTILGYNRRLAEIRELGTGQGIDIQPVIDAAGGIPETMLIEEVPDLASEPAFSDRGAQKQTLLFDGDGLSPDSQQRGAESVEKNGQAEEALSFIRPDRQETFPGLMHEWPEAQEDRDTMVIDRVGVNMPEGSHRFTIKRGDYVNAHFTSNRKVHPGRVTGISHARQEIAVDGIWHSRGCIYPAVEPGPEPTPGVPLSEIIEDLNQTNGEQLGEADRLPEPYTYEDWQAFQDQLDTGEMTAEELKAQFARMRASGDTIQAALVKDHNAKELRQWCLRWGRRPESTKAENAKTLYQAMLHSFSLGETICYQPFSGESYADAVAKAVDQVTDQAIEDLARDRQQRQAAREKALTDPETLEEWSLYLRSNGGYHKLSPDQKVTYERLRADRTRQQRRERREKEIEQIDVDEDLELTLKEGFHDKKGVTLWIVQMSTRIATDSYRQLKVKAKELGGWYSSFKKNDAGFQFYDQEAAQTFMSLMDGDVNNAEAMEARRIRKMDNASERLQAVADTLKRDSQAVLEADETKLKNTQRRATMAAHMREDAQSGLATVATLRALASQLESKEIEYLDGINAATQLYTLVRLLNQGKFARIRHELAQIEDDRHGFVSSRRREEMDEEPLCAADVGFTEYPWPHLYRPHLEEAFAKLGNTPGVMRSTAKMRKLIASADPEQKSIAFKNEGAVEVLQDFLGRAKGAGYSCYWFDRCLEDYKRMRAANIHNVFELRTAMRELLPHIGQAEGDSPLTKAIDALRGRKLEGFFPTPRHLIHRMLDEADIQGTDTVFEPNAGMADIIDVIREQHPDVEVSGMELNRTLQDVIEAKGYGDIVTFGDVLEHDGQYDKILMNPPFENGQDAAHLQHAYQLLQPGGRVVCITSEGPWFRSDGKSQAFREWFDERDGWNEQLPDDTFQGVEAFRQTGVRTRLVVIDKPDIS